MPASKLFILLVTLRKTLCQPSGLKSYQCCDLTCAHSEKSIDYNVFLRLNSSLNPPWCILWIPTWKPSLNTEGQGCGANTDGGILGLSGCDTKEWQGEATRPREHCAFVDALVQSSEVLWGGVWKWGHQGGLTPLYQQHSEALSLSRYTSSLGNAVLRQNKHTPRVFCSNSLSTAERRVAWGPKERGWLPICHVGWRGKLARLEVRSQGNSQRAHDLWKVHVYQCHRQLKGEKYWWWLPLGGR